MLHELDHPTQVERPPGYEHAAARARFERLAQRLAMVFGAVAHVDRHVQDASHHGRIELAKVVVASDVRLVLTVSNFGGMVVLSADNPGCHTDAEASELISSEDRDRITAVLAELDYVLVHEEPLWEPYDGKSDALRVLSPQASWWVRFFDYL